MADDKGGGGGSSWGALEIGLVLVLVIGFLTQLQNGFKPSGTIEPAKKQEVVSAPLNQDTCGLTINRPHSLEKVTTFVTLSGSVDGCQWRPTDRVALYAQVIDSYGRPVSEYTTVPALERQYDEAVFNASIYLNTQPTTTKGFVILAPAQTITQQTPNYRIPITFSR
jgi:hypothetical protein